MSLRFLAYRSGYFPAGTVGLVDETGTAVTPLTSRTGAPILELYDIIEDWDAFSKALVRGSPTELIESIQIMAPLRGRDVLAVGKNYKAHAKEFQRSGFDSSDKNEQPDFPVIFTKRASSIVPTGAEIYLHPDVTQSVDYEGELGVIIGKGGIGIKKEDAWDHVWGATIINDVTARERQRDHKQFFIGKSLDTFCPMGPFAVHASCLDWRNLILETKVNGEIRQNQNTAELIFDIPTLIETCSLGMTLQPGDVIATGTPAGVGIGRTPPVYLKSGDKIEITITGLGTLTNTVSSEDSARPTCSPVRSKPPQSNCNSESLARVLPTGMHYSVRNPGASSTIVFIHGLGASSAVYSPLIEASGVDKTHQVIIFDLQGHGLSPLKLDADLTIEDYAESVVTLLDTVKVEQAIIVGHSLGGIIATTFAAKYPSRVSKLFLLGPVTSLPAERADAMRQRVTVVRSQGLSALVDDIVRVSLCKKTHETRLLVKAIVRAYILASPVEGYARACLALATAPDPNYSRINVPVLILAGAEDVTVPKASTDFLHSQINGSKLVTMPEVAHWIMLEDWEGCAKILADFVSE